MIEFQDRKEQNNKVIDKEIFIQQLQKKFLDLTDQISVLRITISSNRLKGEALKG